MALCKQIQCFKFFGTILENSIRGRYLHTAPVHQSVARWRKNVCSLGIKEYLIPGMGRYARFLDNPKGEIDRQLIDSDIKGLPAKGVEYGPLTDLPDWSYSDGQPAPLSSGQKKRIQLHKEYCEQIIKLTAEVDQCVDLTHQKALREEEMRQNALRNHLKEKGEPFS